MLHDARHPDIDPDAKLIVEFHGEDVVNKAAIDAALYAERLRADGDTKGAARWQSIAEGAEEMRQAAGVPPQRGH